MSSKIQGENALTLGENGLNLNTDSSEFQGKRREFVKNSAKVAGIAMLANALPLMANSNSANLAKNSPNSSTNSAKNSASNAQNSKKGQTMTLTQTAQQNTSKLFGKLENSALAKTDPEFVEIYANFAFDEVFSQSGKLDLQTRLKLILGALIATQGHAEFKTMLAASLKNGVSPVEIKEIIYQATAYVGFGKSADFLNDCNEVFKAHKIKLPLDPQKNTPREKRQEWGLSVQRRFFGAAIDKGNAAAPADIKHIRTFLSANCFGDYYTRGGLTLEFRELLTLVILASLGGADSQVRSHIQGNLNIGHDRAFLIEVITALVPYIGYPRSLNALAALDDLTLKK